MRRKKISKKVHVTSLKGSNMLSDDSYSIHSKYAQKVKGRIFFSHERKAKLMNLKLDGPTCNTIWSCYFERDGSGC